MKDEVRQRDYDRLAELCRKYDLDIEAYDLTLGYQEVKEQILKDAGFVDEDKLAESWESMAEYMDSIPLEQKIMAPVGSPKELEMPQNLLIIYVYRQHVSLAVALVESKFKSNLHRFGIVRQANIRGYQIGAAVMWFFSAKQAANIITEEFEKRNISFRVIRNNYIRRDFLHYYNGRFYNIPRGTMEHITKKVSIKLKS